jgi:hypothetical protein
LLRRETTLSFCNTTQLGSQPGLLGYLLTQLGEEVPAVCTMTRFSELARRHLESPSVILLDDIEVALQGIVNLEYRVAGLRQRRIISA